MMMEPAVIVHGGAWSIPDSLVSDTRLGVKFAARTAITILKEGGSAVDAVQAAVVTMENNPVFDAGTGSSLNASGQLEMDAVIMDGRDLRTGAVAAVKNIANPVQLARLVMDKTPHNLLVGAGANEFAKEQGISETPTEQLITKIATNELQTVHGEFTVTVDDLYNHKSAANTSNKFINNHTAVEGHGAVTVTSPGVGCDTVGAVAIDRHGNVAFATSTGGITGKRPGRVGDSPIVGHGGYADNEVGSVSATGHGESISKVCLAYHTIALMRQGLSGLEAVETALKNMSRRVNGCGGLIVVDSRTGALAHYSTAERMAWASASRDQLRHGVELTDDIVESL